MKTYLPTADEIERKWLVVDAEGQILGRLAVEIANVLRGRHKPTYTPHIDVGDFVVVINADKVALSGQKESKKTYDRYSGYMGGRRVTNLSDVRANHPERIIEHAVKGMMPRNRMGRKQLRKLKIYAGSEHPHASQQPETVVLT